MKRLLPLLLAFMVAVPMASAQPTASRLVYEIVVTNPGTRSQGWKGTLFDSDGTAISVPPGEEVTLPFGTFVSVQCRELWVPCGMIESGTVRWMGAGHGNESIDGLPWSYRLSVTAEGTKSEGWVGELVHAGQSVPLSAASAETPMGRYLPRDSGQAWGWHGWVHEAWNSPR